MDAAGAPRHRAGMANSRRMLLFVSAALAGCASLPESTPQAPPAQPATAPQDDIQWTDVGDWLLEGRAFADRKAPYDRLPAAAEGVVRKEVWDLSRDSAGIAVRFASDAPAIHVRYRVTDGNLAMGHMPATGVSGVDLYARDDQGQLRWVQVTRPNAVATTMKMIDGLEPRRREFLAYLPLYNGVRELEFGVPAPHRIEPVAPPAGGQLVVYGTSITHGASASRPGMAWPAIVGRQLDRAVVNLGFSGNGRMEAEVGRFVASLPAAAFVIDCLPNMTPEMVAERAVPLVKQLRAAHSTTPILLVEDRTFQNAWLQPKTLQLHERRRKALRDAFAKLQAEGVSNLHLVGGATLLGTDDDGSTDGSHPNDLGMWRQAEAVVAALRPLL